MRTSQKQNILRHLLYGPLCGQERDWSLGNRIPARIYDLRQVGFQIGKRECDQGHDHRTYQVEFYVEADLADWCVDCGVEGALPYVDGPHKRDEGHIWLPVACDKCGKGDWR